MCVTTRVSAPSLCAHGTLKGGHCQQVAMQSARLPRFSLRALGLAENKPASGPGVSEQAQWLGKTATLFLTPAVQRASPRALELLQPWTSAFATRTRSQPRACRGCSPSRRSNSKAVVVVVVVRCARALGRGLLLAPAADAGAARRVVVVVVALAVARARRRVGGLRGLERRTLLAGVKRRFGSTRVDRARAAGRRSVLGAQQRAVPRLLPALLGDGRADEAAQPLELLARGRARTLLRRRAPSLLGGGCLRGRERGARSGRVQMLSEHSEAVSWPWAGLGRHAHSHACEAVRVARPSRPLPLCCCGYCGCCVPLPPSRAAPRGGWPSAERPARCAPETGGHPQGRRSGERIGRGARGRHAARARARAGGGREGRGEA